MKTTLIAILAIVLTSCRLTETTDKGSVQNTKTSPTKESTYMAEQIKIDGLQSALTKLENGQTEFQFIGITSNGTDCIYFMPENGKFNIDYEAMELDQVPYIDKLKRFADSKHFKSVMTTYGNTPQYESDQKAAVIHIETNSSLGDVAKLGEQIESEIFRNNANTVYEIVP